MPDEITPSTQQDSSVERNKGKEVRDIWDKLETAAKIIGGVSIPILGLVVTFMLGTQSENHRETQFQASMVTERERADSEIREKMFDFLLTRYFSAEQKASSKNVEDFRTRLMVLRLLLENFQEHFSSKSLLAHLFGQIKEAEAKPGDDAKRWRALKMELIDVGKNTTSEQLISLAPVSVTIKDVYVPLNKVIDPNSRDQSKRPLATSSFRIALYRREGLRGGELEFENSQLPGLPGNEGGDRKTVRYSIILSVEDIREDAAKTHVIIYEDKYVNNEFDAPHSLRLDEFTFDASYFSTPYVDNTLLPNGSRFAVIYRDCMDADEKDMVCRFPVKPNRYPRAIFDVVIFKAGFLSRRDRPDIDQLLKETTKSNSWWNFSQPKP